jgi:hypothetical protein
MPSEQLEYWPHFNSIDLNLSLDGVGKRFEYLRFPAEWETVKANVREFISMTNTRPTVIHTVSVLNVGYLKEILDFCTEHGITLFVNPLHQPALLSVSHAPEPVRAWVREQLSEVDCPDVAHILEQMNSDTYSDPQDILDYCHTLDQRRGTSLSQTFPELVKALHV